MSDYMRITEVVPKNRMAVVDTVTGTIIGIHDGLVMTYLPHTLNLDDDEAIVQQAKDHGFPLYIDLDE